MNQPEHDEPFTARRVEMAEFREDIATFLLQTQQGASFLIVSQDKVVAELRPPSLQKPAPREPGRMRGKIWMADDFDTWPESFIQEMVDGEIFPPERRGE